MSTISHTDNSRFVYANGGLPVPCTAQEEVKWLLALPPGISLNPNYGQVTEVEVEDPPTVPLILSKTAFQDHAVAQLGGGAVGMARFTAIMDATRDSTSGSVRFCFARYEAAITFEKTNVAALTSIMAGDSTTGHLTAAERTAILDAWPEG